MGRAPKLDPAASAAFGEIMMPARSANWDSSGLEGAFNTRRTVSGSMTSTASMAFTSPTRMLPLRVWSRRIL